MDTQRVFEILDSYRPQITSTLQRWVQAKSVGTKSDVPGAPFGPDVRKMLDVALEDAKSLGFDVKDVDGYAMRAAVGGGDRTMGILCHLDVVPEGDGWTYPPYGGTLVGNRLYGRGSVDDKGSAVACLYAVKAIMDAGIPFKHGVHLIFGCDEETGMSDLRYYAAHEQMPDYGFSPDAEFPVINLEKGHVNFRLLATGDGKELVSIYAGDRMNMVPGIAEAVLKVEDKAAFAENVNKIKVETGYDIKLEDAGDSVKLSVVGQGAHASMPQLGKNAAGMLMQVFKFLGIGGELRPAIAALADKLGLEGFGESLGAACEDELSGRLTCNFGCLRYKNGVLSATLDMRVPETADVSRIASAAVMAFEHSGVAVSLLHHAPAYHVDANSREVQGLLAAYSEVTGQEGYAFSIGGGTYSRMMPGCVAFGPCFPGEEDLCHVPDEFMDMDKLMTAAKIYCLAILKLAC